MSRIKKTTVKTPGVYITEIAALPPSVAQVETAIPAFIGYTEKASRNGEYRVNKAIRISSFIEYVQYFGDAYDNITATVTLDHNNNVGNVTIEPIFQLFNAIRMYFNNGGSVCYIISPGLYDPVNHAKMKQFIDPLATPPINCFDI